MFTINGTGTTIYGSAYPMPLVGEEAGLAQELELNPYSYQVVKWFTVLFLPIVPLGTYRVVKVKQGFWSLVSAEFLMQPMQRDWRQVFVHYLVGWSAPIVIFLLLGLMPLLQNVAPELANRLELPILLVVILAIGGAFVVLFSVMSRRGGPTLEDQAHGFVEPAKPMVPEVLALEMEILEPALSADIPPVQVQGESPFAPASPRPSGCSGWGIVLFVIAALGLVLFLCCSGVFFWSFYHAPRRAEEVVPPMHEQWEHWDAWPDDFGEPPRMGMPPMGLPAEEVVATGEPVTSETKLAVGDQLLAEWGSGWYGAEVVELMDDGQVRVYRSGWGSKWDEVLPRSRLRLPPAER